LSPWRVGHGTPILMLEPPGLVSREQLENELQHDLLPDSDTLRSHMYNLRKGCGERPLMVRRGCDPGLRVPAPRICASWFEPAGPTRTRNPNTPTMVCVGRASASLGRSAIRRRREALGPRLAARAPGGPCPSNPRRQIHPGHQKPIAPPAKRQPRPSGVTQAWTAGSAVRRPGAICRRQEATGRRTSARVGPAYAEKVQGSRGQAPSRPPEADHATPPSTNANLRGHHAIDRRRTSARVTPAYA
jgi:hypothetical protein